MLNLEPSLLRLPTLHSGSSPALPTRTFNFREIFKRAFKIYGMVPVRYRPNAASGGWSYGRDLSHCREKGRFGIISLNIHKTTSRRGWHLHGCCTSTSTADFCLLGKAPSQLFYSSSKQGIFSRDLQVCQCIRTQKLM